MSTEHPLMADIRSLADPATWQRSVEGDDRALSVWLDRQKQPDLARIYLVGCGTSLYAAQVGKYVIEHIAHVPAEALQAFAFATYAEPATLGPRTLVIGISATGGTQAVCDALARARAAGAPTLGLTSKPDSDIALLADGVIGTGTADRVAVKSKTYVQSLIALYLLALHLAERRGTSGSHQGPYWRRQIELAAEGNRRLILERQPEIECLASLYAESAKVFVLGTGPNAGTAEEGSLKVIEMAKIFSEAQELEDFLHGRLREVDCATPMIFLAPSGRADGRILDFLTVTDYVGAPSVVLTDCVTDGIERLATHIVQMPGPLDEFATPLLYIVPMYLFGYHLALARGYDPAARRYPGIVPQSVSYSNPPQRDMRLGR